MSMEGAAWSSLYKISTAKGSDRKISRETLRRILAFASPYRRQLIGFLILSTGGAFLAVATPVLAGEVVNAIVASASVETVIWLAVLIAVVAVADAGVSLATRWFSSRIGEQVILDLRTAVFDHVQRMPIAFFTRTRTGALVSRLNTWTFNHAMAYNPDAKEFLLLKLKMDNSGFRYTAFFSPDGRNWKEHPQSPLFYDGDAISLFWSTQRHRFILISKSLQPFPKHFRDHGGGTPGLKDDALRDRRVLAFRSSPDGRVWEPSDSMEDVWNRGGHKKPRPDNVLTSPDTEDPPDLEFYSGNGFWYHDRCYLMVLNYAASPLAARKHGPHLDTEWWVGHDGLHWERPGRGINATGAEVTRLTHNPMLIGGLLLLHYGNRVLGMKQDRVSFVSARANGEFSTHPFLMPAADLVLNAAIPASDRSFVAASAYVMADVLDERGQIIPGFEAEKCVLQKADAIDLPLRWNGRSARELVGRLISLRFHLRSANIYAVTTK